MRLFISIDFPDDVLAQIQSWIPEMKGWKKPGKNQLHLTLTFLGDCTEIEKNEIHSLLSDISISPFTVTISGLGAFPNESSPRIIWAGINQNEELLKLQKNITACLKDYIKSKESHIYIPHVTLARKKSKKSINHVAQENLKKETPDLNVYIDTFYLKKSILKPEGSEHQILYQYEAMPDE